MMSSVILVQPCHRWCVTFIILLLLQILCFFQLPVASALSLSRGAPPILSSSSSASSKSGSKRSSSRNSLTKDMGESALEKVQWLGGLVSQSGGNAKEEYKTSGEDDLYSPMSRKQKVEGTGGSVYNTFGFASETGVGETGMTVTKLRPKERQVWTALSVLERDMQALDRIAGETPQISAVEASLLIGAVLSAFCGPLILGGHITEFLAPSAAAFSAAIGIGAEYTGKVAVADGKEIAAAAIQCSAEAEGILANAERTKAICPLCVGIGATSATLALLVPVLLDSLGFAANMQLMTQIYLLCPIVAILAAAVASLALQDTRSYCNQAIGVGNRRFAKAGIVGRTWLSSTELVSRKSANAAEKWKTFSFAVLPAPLLGSLVPGALPTKTIVVAALAAAQSALFLAQAENELSRATDAVALKCRSAAVCDTYANQGARSSAILPFTSALSSLCAAATAAIVELPFVEALSMSGTASATIVEMFTVALFPAGAAILAAAASVSKARCEVDAEAAKQAASTLALQYRAEEEDPVLQPLRGVGELIKLALANSIKLPMVRFARRLNIRRRFRVVRKWFQKRKKRLQQKLIRDTQ